MEPKRLKALIAFLLALVGIPVAIYLWDIWIPQRDFRVEEWTAPGADDPPSGRSTRQAMIKSLIEDVLPGKQRAEVQELLGAGCFEASEYFSTRGLAIEIGYEKLLTLDLIERAFFSNCETLIIYFDEHGLFSGWYIYGSPRWPRIVGSPGNATYGIRPIVW